MAKKTSIEHLKDLDHAPWISEIGSFLGRSNKRYLGGRNLHYMCRTALAAQVKHPDDRVIRYVISALFHMKVKDSDIPILEAFLLKALVVDPRAADLICALSLNLIHEKRPIKADRVLRRVLPFVERALEIGHDYEACWGLYLLRGMKTPIGRSAIGDLAAEYEGAVVPLLLLDIEAKGNIKGLPNKSWERKIKKAEFDDWTWLLAYEGVRHGWLHGSCLSHPLLEPMNNKNVVFYDERHNVVSRVHSSRERALGERS